MYNSIQINQLINDGSLTITPFDETLLKPASYTFRLGGVYNQIAQTNVIAIAAGKFVILESLETISFPNNIAGILSTRGSIAKLGLDCLLSDTIIEPGSTGKLTFCTKNQSDKAVTLDIGTPLVKCLFIKTG